MYKEAANQKLVKANSAKIELSVHESLIKLSGDWLWLSINEDEFKDQLKHIRSLKQVAIDGSNIGKVDTNGIYFMLKLERHLKQNNIHLVSFKLNPDEEDFYKLIVKQLADDKDKPTNLSIHESLLLNIGKSIFDTWDWLLNLLAFFGNYCVDFISVLRSPKNLNLSEVSRTINNAGVKGLWVACLLSFLIGLTLAYQMAPQFTTYGANVYVVNFLGIALLKEVSPLLTAVIVAGRTGAAITAEIGTQKVQEEIDALQTMGISPISRLVVPKVIGVMIALPLITALADMCSMIGGAIVANSLLSVNYSLFLWRMQNYLSVNNYLDGLVKSVAFAFVISLVGCFCGLSVKSNANSIGEQTTKSVVMSIVLIVLFDALFAMIFRVLGV